jgi:hypothetical protein
LELLAASPRLKPPAHQTEGIIFVEFPTRMGLSFGRLRIGLVHTQLGLIHPMVMWIWWMNCI